jgi:hypothetical protein
MKTKKINTKNILTGIAGVALALVLAAAYTWVVMMLWNWLVPNIFPSAPELTFWQTYGVMALIDLLLSGAKKLKRKD